MDLSGSTGKVQVVHIDPHGAVGRSNAAIFKKLKRTHAYGPAGGASAAGAGAAAAGAPSGAAAAAGAPSGATAGAPAEGGVWEAKPNGEFVFVPKRHGTAGIISGEGGADGNVGARVAQDTDGASEHAHAGAAKVFVIPNKCQHRMPPCSPHEKELEEERAFNDATKGLIKVGDIIDVIKEGAREEPVTPEDLPELQKQLEEAPEGSSGSSSDTVQLSVTRPPKFLDQNVEKNPPFSFNASVPLRPTRLQAQLGDDIFDFDDDFAGDDIVQVNDLLPHYYGPNHWCGGSSWRVKKLDGTPVCPH